MNKLRGKMKARTHQALTILTSAARQPTRRTRVPRYNRSKVAIAVFAGVQRSVAERDARVDVSGGADAAAAGDGAAAEAAIVIEGDDEEEIDDVAAEGDLQSDLLLAKVADIDADGFLELNEDALDVVLEDASENDDADGEAAAVRAPALVAGAGAAADAPRPTVLPPHDAAVARLRAQFAPTVVERRSRSGRRITAPDVLTM